MLKPWLLCLALLAGSAWADSWTGRDKTLHFAGSAALAAALTISSKDPPFAFWSTVAVGAAKELVDLHRRRGDASARDLVADVAGAYLGTQAGRWLIYRRGPTTHVVLAWSY